MNKDNIQFSILFSFLSTARICKVSFLSRIVSHTKVIIVLNKIYLSIAGKSDMCHSLKWCPLAKMFGRLLLCICSPGHYYGKITDRNMFQGKTFTLVHVERKWSLWGVGMTSWLGLCLWRQKLGAKMIIYWGIMNKIIPLLKPDMFK